MKFVTKELLDKLQDETVSVLEAGQGFEKLSLEELNWKESTDKWSVLECLEHLNLYGNFYLPEIEKQIQFSKYPPRSEFKSSWLGDWCEQSMLPEGGINKMNTFKDKNPNGSQLDKAVLKRFEQQQQKIMELLQRARAVDIQKTKTAITIPLLRLRLGDTFRFVISHNLRHIKQAQVVLERQGVSVLYKV